ncbi:lipid-binding SYLF domain-containing protein [Coralloluteibacterium thermophilus]|uniref:Lipid-binding SYLF domain-containing protein n=1 Tax=Coralloluteibacterium thermophilum TaxID=2707049 RepID=A0ABV9NLI8_9GAMM
MRLPARILALPVLLALAGTADAGPREDQRAIEAVQVLDTLMQVPESAIPEALLREAQAVAVFPNVVKAGLIIGGRRGHGLISVRSPDGTWSHPSFITLTGGSIGFQAGVQGSDLVLVFRSQRGVDSIVHGKFTLGADAAVAAGPVGRMAQASTDEQLRAEILAYARSRGLFAGIAIDGAVMSIDHRSNQGAYGPNTTPRAVFENRVGAASTPIVDFRDRLEEYSQPRGAGRVTTPAGTGGQPLELRTIPADEPPAATEAIPLQQGPAPTQGFEPVPEPQPLPEDDRGGW